MISRISLLKCREGVSEEAFRDGMMGAVHDVIAAMPELRAGEINFVTDRQQRSHLGRGAIDIDGFIEMFFDSYGDMVEGVASLHGEGANDVPMFANPHCPILVLTKRTVMKIPAYLQGKKLIQCVSFLGRADGVSSERFAKEWWNVHDHLVHTIPGCVGCNQNLVIDRLVQGKPVHYADLPVEGMVEFWFEDMDAFDECYSTTGFKLRASVHAAEFIGTVTTYFVQAVPVELKK